MVFLKVSTFRSGVDVGESLADLILRQIQIDGGGVKNFFFVGREINVDGLMAK